MTESCSWKESSHSASPLRPTTSDLFMVIFPTGPCSLETSDSPLCYQPTTNYCYYNVSNCYHWYNSSNIIVRVYFMRPVSRVNTQCNRLGRESALYRKDEVNIIVDKSTLLFKRSLNISGKGNQEKLVFWWPLSWSHKIYLKAKSLWNDNHSPVNDIHNRFPTTQRQDNIWLALRTSSSRMTGWMARWLSE